MSEKCQFKTRPVTTWDLDHNQGSFAELLAYFGGIFKVLCLILFFIITTEYGLIYVTKLGKLRKRTMEKLIVLRRVICIILSKIGFVVVSYMSSYTESDKFAFISTAEADCSHDKNLVFELD